MRFNNTIKGIPFIFTLLLLIFLGITNQKENTKLRLLIWNTPTLSLASYIAISTSTGFILGYSINSIIGKLITSQAKKQLTFRDNYQESQVFDDIGESIKPKYDYTLIERDFNDPSPTITADFRIISRKEDAYNEYVRNNMQDDDLSQAEVKYSENFDQNKANNNDNFKCTDWYDQSFLDW